MIRIVRTATLAALRAQAAARGEEAAEARRQAEAAAADALTAREHIGRLEAALTNTETRRREAQANFDGLSRDTAAALVRLWNLGDTDPAAHSAVQGGIALHVLRSFIAEARASGDPARIAAVRPLDAVIGEDGRRAAAEGAGLLPGGVA